MSFSNTTSLSCTTPIKTTKCLQTNIKVDIKTITTYLVKERALKVVQAALKRINNTYKQCRGLGWVCCCSTRLLGR